MSESGLNTDAAVLSQPPMPVRRLHNYLYCPRLFYLQWVENLFEENADTAEGSAKHRQVDAPSRFDDEKAEALRNSLPEGARLRSLRIESESLGLVGVIDLIESNESGLEIADYKKGAARRLDDGTIAPKEPDAVQLAAYALLLREHGTAVAAATVYYAAERRRVPVELDEALFAKTRTALAEARATAAAQRIPPPLPNDTRCLYCSAYPICLPRESAWWQRASPRTAAQPGDWLPGLAPEAIRELGSPPDLTEMPPRPPRDDGEVLVVQTAGAQIGQRGGEFTVSLKTETIRKLPVHQLRAIYVFGAVQLTAQAVQTALEEEIDVAYFSPSGRFLGLLRGLPASGIDARLGQYRHFGETFFRLHLAREVIRAKIHNQRVMLMRNGEVPDIVLSQLARIRDSTAEASSLSELLGIEGTAANLYFQQFASMLKTGESWKFDFAGRNRRPPRDPINALLSLGYSVLAKEIAGVCHAVGLDPFYGFMHQPRYGRPALALDLMEEFRPLVADSVAISLVNRGEIDEGDFVRASTGTALNERGRRRFWEAWFRRLDTEVSHPEFGYKMSYRRMFEVQARQLWRYVRGDAATYHGFTTR
ncbi:MAG TPA: CRISPR-associated endonuclease Cas1 [Opitutaceae bacterium]|nr:CRISPR-associated endonuclease Cas1 [Opitutaceae bacterium]HPK50366.1 CRISPR-associated endonuclease Cas1 [Opitutaceae bacterium]